MTRRLIEAMVVCALILAGCGDEGTDTLEFSGVGAAEITATGRIIGFGSHFVNGIEYDTSGASVTINEQPAGAQDLRLGMVVTVEGERSGSTNGTADSVVYDAAVRGPVSSIVDEPDGDDEARRLTMVGAEVVIDADTTAFEGTGFGSVAVNDVIEASGYFDAAGRLQATYVEDLDVFSPGNNQVEVSGIVSNQNLSNASFQIDGLIVFYVTGTTQLPTTGINNGDTVEVEGTVSAANSTTIDATAIKQEDVSLPQGIESVEIEGIVTDFTGLADFRVNGRPVDAGGGAVQFRPTSLAGSLGNGERVLVEGAVSAGVLAARRVEAARGPIEAEAFISAVDTTAFTFTLQITSSGTLTFAVDNKTQFDDETGAATTTFALGELATGDYVRIAAYQTDSGDIIASHIKRVTPGSRIELQGPIDDLDITAQNLDILGVDFDANVGSTDFTVANVSSNANDFFTGLTQGALVRVEEGIASGTTSGDGVAEEMWR